MDQDGSGAIDAEELGAAFKLLGIRMKRAELSALLAEVDHDGSGEVEYPEFLEIMTVTLQRLSEEEGSEKNEGQVPFALMATAYRRKRLMEGIINGDKEVQAQIQQISDKANLEALQATKAAEVEALRAKAAAAAEGGGGGAASGGGAAGVAGVALPGRTPSGRPLRRLGQVDPLKGPLLDTLGPDERRIVSSLAAKVPAAASSRAPPPPLNLLGSTRPYGHFANSPTHRQLMEQPQLLDLRFVHSSTIRLPPGATGPARSMSGNASLSGMGMGGGGGGGTAERTSGGTATGGGGGAAFGRRTTGASVSGMGGFGGAGPGLGGGGIGGGGGGGGRMLTPPMSLSGAAQWGAALLPSSSLNSPGRGGGGPGQGQRVDGSEPLPQLRYEGGGVPYGGGAKLPMGVRLGTVSSGPHDRVARS
ncbi:hypothetical protein HXX76_014730 [Chlamydomonas incerta]|uniref:EF-hand domain-containing protein n=1 Tax=Chlamydomonas incerta TaxID=51695 RepID=A0A835VPB1_CHLIN|nr:hypothetical protein HXX76_014730 [Chlamydomonas incerta]|eukprot:KAG2424197.1 hypothetical protein HXX76_014730 [Chlamydomonas incerta]